MKQVTRRAAQMRNFQHPRLLESRIVSEMENRFETASRGRRSIALLDGFTLIELMITVAVIAILATIALPSYEQHIIKGRRRDAQSVMMDLANREQQFLLADRSYANTNALAAAGYSPPPDATQFYAWAVATGFDASGSPFFTITFTPSGPQASDGALTLDQTGLRLPSSKW